VSHLAVTQQPPAEPITDVDSTAVDALLELLGELRDQEVVLAFAEMKGPVKDRLRRYRLLAEVGTERLFPTVGTAVDGYLRATGLEWVDWEERPDGHRNG
jgi:MFS superfamily sulfate permease-like transporter